MAAEAVPATSRAASAILVLVMVLSPRFESLLGSVFLKSFFFATPFVEGSVPRAMHVKWRSLAEIANHETARDFTKSVNEM